MLFLSTRSRVGGSMKTLLFTQFSNPTANQALGKNFIFK
jgi:hypothetical protein